MILTQKQLEALALGRCKNLTRHRPRGISYKIKKVNRGWFKLGHSLNKGGNNPMFGKIPWNKNLKNIHLSPKTEWKPRGLIGKKNYRWKGDKVGYFGLHSWIYRKLGKPKYCQECGKTSGKFQWHSIVEIMNIKEI